MAHAPIIFPAVLGRPLPYRPWFWLPLALLHGGLLIRVIGDALGRGALAASLVCEREGADPPTAAELDAARA